MSWEACPSSSASSCSPDVNAQSDREAIPDGVREEGRITRSQSDYTHPSKSFLLVNPCYFLTISGCLSIAINVRSMVINVFRSALR